MADKVKQWLKKIFVYRLFNKVFFVYFLITLFSSVVLLYILSKNLGTIKYDQAMNMSDQVVSTVDGYMQEKFESEKSIFQRFIQQPDQWEAVCELLSAPKDTAPDTDKEENIRKEFSKTAYAIDRDYTDIYAYGFDSQKILSLGHSVDSGNYYYFETMSAQTEAVESTAGKMVTSRGNHLNNVFSVYVLDRIHPPGDFVEDIGVLGMCFQTRNIRNAYENLEEYLKGNLYILDGAGGIIYDSMAEYRDEQIPLDYLTRENVRFTLGANVYNVSYNDQNDYYVVNRIPLAEISQDVKILQESIFRILIMVILLSLLVSFVSTRYFSGRLGVIRRIMDQVKEGKLSGFKEKKQVQDEVGDIYRELIDMCGELENHINKEYVYQLRQKEMELYALQAQINPHFLYNTLESIRMNLYVKGEREASNMIYILSDMFRNIMKKDAVVTIREEISYVNSYLELYRFRFGDSMEYEVTVEDNVYSYATIKHILQPIIENALIHGVPDTSSKENPVHIAVKVSKKEEDILFLVEDDGCGIEAEKLEEIRQKLLEDDMVQDSVGIYNVNNRLKIVYGKDYQLEVDSKAGSGTRVLLKIRAIQKKELEKYVQALNS